MGVDYYNCKNCGDIFPDCSAYGYCEGCGVHWCQSCKSSVEVFVFDGEKRCDFCWKDTPKRVKSSQLLTLAIKKLKTTHDELEAEFRAQAGPEFREAKDRFYCTECPEGDCANEKCERVAESFDLDDPEDNDQHRGYCCQAQVPHGLESDDFCEPCQQWLQRQLAIQLLGIRKFRPAVGLQVVPKDVIISYLI